jgi:hypothetical protein
VYNEAFKDSSIDLNSPNDIDLEVIGTANATANVAAHNEIKYNKWVYILCCISSKPSQTIENNVDTVERDNVMTKEEEARQAALSAQEAPKWRSLCNMNAIIVIAIGSFFWGYYA